MQFIKFSNSTKLSDLNKHLGRANTQHILAANDLNWSPNVGAQYREKCNEIINSSSNVPAQRKATILNSMVSDDDVFEKAALASEDEWKVLSALGAFQDALKVPETLHIPDSSDVLGSSVAVKKTVYDAAMKQLETTRRIDPSIFNEYSAIKHSNFIQSGPQNVVNPFQMFRLPWGKITLTSSLSATSVDFPVYPEDPSNSRSATYQTMPEMLYQYEPWQLYQSSGPRQVAYKFNNIHRDMWSGDHSDGQANNLIRFCEANCYPKYNGSIVNTAICSLYVEGQYLIRGVITDVSTDWFGPILDDGWYAAFNLSLSITEVSDVPLNYEVVRAKPLIG